MASSVPIVAICGVRGGVGATTITRVFAEMVVASCWRTSVLLIDLDLFTWGLSTLYAVKPPRSGEGSTLSNALLGGQTEVIHPIDVTTQMRRSPTFDAMGCLLLLPASSPWSLSALPQALSVEGAFLVQRLREAIDTTVTENNVSCVLVDCGSAVTPLSAAAAEVARCVILIGQNDPISHCALRAWSNRIRNIYPRFDSSKTRIVINKARSWEAAQELRAALDVYAVIAFALDIADLSEGIEPPEVSAVAITEKQIRDLFHGTLDEDIFQSLPNPVPLAFEAARKAGVRFAEFSSPLRHVLPPGLRSIARTARGAFGGFQRLWLRELDCTVFAARRVAPRNRFLVTVWAHRPCQASRVAEMTREFDGPISRRGVTSLSTRIRKGSKLAFELSLPLLEIDEPFKDLAWRGRPDSVGFIVTVPPDLSPQTIAGTVNVYQDTVPIGQVCFTVEVCSERQMPPEEFFADGVTVKGDPCGEGKRYDLAFISYASQDRPEVLRRVPMLSAVGIRYFQDILSLEPGDEWHSQIHEWIDQSDVFLLFWSSHARSSKWVEDEWRHALKRPLKGFIRPVIIEGPPIPAPPQELAHLHFSDKTRYVLQRPGS